MKIKAETELLPSRDILPAKASLGLPMLSGGHGKHISRGLSASAHHLWL